MGVPLTITIKRGDFDMRGYDVMRTQFFASANMISVSFSSHGIRFSTACVRKFGNTEYIDLQIDPYNHKVAAVPCSEHYKDKMLWAKLCADGISVRSISASAYLATLYEIFGWNTDKRYRLRGEIFGTGSGGYALFDTKTPEIFSSRYEMAMPWATGFGEDYYCYRQSRMVFGVIGNGYAEYDSEPELQPTTRETADDNVRALIKKMQSEGRYFDDRDILC